MIHLTPMYDATGARVAFGRGEPYWHIAWRMDGRWRWPSLHLGAYRRRWSDFDVWLRLPGLVVCIERFEAKRW
jgi:hypothetical protein